MICTVSDCITTVSSLLIAILSFRAYYVEAPASSVVWLLLAAISLALALAMARIVLLKAMLVADTPAKTIRQDAVSGAFNAAASGVNYAAKCKRMRRNQPTPCLHCEGECRG